VEWGHQLPLPLLMRVAFKQNKTLLTGESLQNLIRPSNAQLLWFNREIREGGK
jgi:hypothetical protein